MAEQVSDHSAMRLLFNATSVFNARPKPDLTTTPALPTSKSTCSIIANTITRQIGLHTPYFELLMAQGVFVLNRFFWHHRLSTSLKQAQNNEVSDGGVLPVTKVILVTNGSLFPFFFFFSLSFLSVS